MGVGGEGTSEETPVITKGGNMEMVRHGQIWETVQKTIFRCWGLGVTSTHRRYQIITGARNLLVLSLLH